MKLATPYISTKRLTWHAADKTLCCEASELTCGPTRAWDDSCDVGFTVVSSRTGLEIQTVLSHTERRDGDVLWEDFTPIDKSQRALLSRLRIFND
jgi:hypothetical protein